MGSKAFIGPSARLLLVDNTLVAGRTARSVVATLFELADAEVAPVSYFKMAERRSRLRRDPPGPGLPSVGLPGPTVHPLVVSRPSAGDPSGETAKTCESPYV
jgi:hypothetical protein